MELESKINNIKIPSNIRRDYALSGLGGSGVLSLTFANGSPTISENFFIHLSCTAKLPLVKIFHFEALAIWEKTKDGFSFVSYEEKDLSKKILKKWEFGTEGINFIENKKGLVLEREIQYFKTPDQTGMIFDPVSAGTVALIEKPSRDLCIFGKQRIMHIKTSKQGDQLKVEAVSGINELWTKTLNQAVIQLNKESFVESIEIPSPLQLGPVTIGKVKMALKEQASIDIAKIEKIVQEFRAESF